MDFKFLKDSSKFSWLRVFKETRILVENLKRNKHGKNNTNESNKYSMVIEAATPEESPGDIELYGGKFMINAGKKKAIITINPQNINPIIERNLPHFAHSLKKL